MRFNKTNPVHTVKKVLAFVVISLCFFTACKDEYLMDNSEPSWLGTNIYDSLKSNGNFKNYIRLIDDLGYKEVLQLTGSKTLFVATDSSFNEFYKNNEWSVSNYDQLSSSQKKQLLYFSMIDNAYVLKTLANYYSNSVFYEGTAMRRLTSLSVTDSIPYDFGNNMPDNPYWDYFHLKGIHVLKDNSVKPIVFFTKQFLNNSAITDEDFKTLTGKSRSGNDVYIFSNKIVSADNVCKNGYFHVLKDVLIPQKNMAEYIETNSGTSIFAKLMNRFCAPYYEADVDINYKILHPEFTDSIYTKHYFAVNGKASNYPSSKRTSGNTPFLFSLPFDPGWNAYTSSSTAAIQGDMAAMFVPSDDAMNAYFNSDLGSLLKERYHTWDNVPDKIIQPLLKRHMRPSLIESVPSKFSKMVDDENYALPVTKNNIDKSYVSVNGVVYVTNAVYPPVDYISVYGPVLFNDNARVMNWAINISETNNGVSFAFYKLYLNSLVSKYALFIPGDEYFLNPNNYYIDPVAYGQTGTQGALKFWYNDLTSSVDATIYKYDKSTGIVGDSVGIISGASNPAFLKNRLWDLMDSHIVVGGVNSGDKYFITKANDFVKIDNSGAALKVQGGQDIQKGTASNVVKKYDQSNGNTYVVDKRIEPSLNSVYKTLSTTSEFSEFFTLLNGVPDTCKTQIFGQQGIDFRIKFFNAYRYTVYVPTNAAIKNALANHVVPTWDSIYAISNNSQKYQAMQKMIRFLKYHFQDNAVFFGQNINEEFQSATIKDNTTSTYFGTYKNKYLKIGVAGDANSLKLTMDSKATDKIRTANVLTEDPETHKSLYNIIAKDYIFSNLPSTFKNVDGTGSTSGTLFSSSTITTSASAVIHQIDNVLTFE